MQVDIAFLMDVSGSVKKHYVRAMNMAHFLVRGLNHASSRTRVAYVSYADTVTTHFLLNSYVSEADFLNALEVHGTGGRSNTAEALRTLKDQIFVESRGDRTGVRNIAIVMTDGQSIDTRETSKQATQLKNAQVEVFSVGIGDYNWQSELDSIASEPDNRHSVTLTSDTESLNVANKLLDWICWEYLCFFHN